MFLFKSDRKNGADFSGQKVLCVGGSLSAEDICLNCWKNGATYSHVSTRRSGGFGYVDWPPNVEERKSIVEIKENSVIFEDDTEIQYDAIIKVRF